MAGFLHRLGGEIFPGKDLSKHDSSHQSQNVPRLAQPLGLGLKPEQGFPTDVNLTEKILLVIFMHVLGRRLISCLNRSDVLNGHVLNAASSGR
jgi:hypothetical protein